MKDKSIKDKSVHSCRFVHHTKFYCIMTTLNKLFRIEFERGTGKEPQFDVKALVSCVSYIYQYRTLEYRTLEYQYRTLEYRTLEKKYFSTLKFDRNFEILNGMQ